jgi:integrase
MLESIDRGSPIGKRDYAILLLVAKLGIRVGDLKALKLHNLNWNTKTIEINQSKTGRHISYPILDDIGCLGGQTLCLGGQTLAFVFFGFRL